MSGWTALTIDVDDEQTAENIDAELRASYEGREPYSATGYADCTVQVGRHANHQSVADEFAAEFPEADRIVVVSANDTSDSGHGTLFEVEGGSAEEIDRKRGYEGAKGRDVTGYFREEHGVTGYATWEA